MAKVAIIFCLFFALAANCSNNGVAQPDDGARPQVPSKEEPAGLATDFHPAAHDFNHYVPYLAGKRVGLIVNQTSTTEEGHLVDALLQRGVQISTIFAPEHGFRGTADAGATVADGRDTETGLPIVSLYGRNKKPTAAQLADVDVLVFDIQDVGVRFYTYIWTLYYAMEAAARHGKQVMVLDRPNPNGQLVDGPLLKTGFESFLGLAPIPAAHGMTVGEFAQMVNGEAWLPEGLRASLMVIPMQGYRRDLPYELSVPPSPNLPNQRSVYLYPHLCWFEGTALSIGRGTDKQFQVIGHPNLTYGDFYFTPRPGPGSANPKLDGQRCRGLDLTTLAPQHLVGLREFDLSYLLRAYRDLSAQGIPFFTRPEHFDLLAGTDELRKSIEAGQEIEHIRTRWNDALASFKERRKPYLLYP